MTVESDNNESAPPEKLLIDNTSDFQFHAAYLTYSDTFDKTENLEIKNQLNLSIKALKDNHKPVPSGSQLSTPLPQNSHKNTEKTRMAPKSAKTRKK